MSTRTAFLAAALGGLLLLLLFAPDADAGTYTVRECHHSAPQNDFSEGIAEASPSPGPYGISAGAAICGNAGAEYALRIAPQSTALNGQSGSIRFVAPDGTRLTGVALDARLRSEKGHRARLSMANAAGIERKRFAIGPAGPADFAPYSWTAPGPAGALDQFVASLTCDNPGFDCPATDEGAKAETAIRNIRLTLRDNVAPTVSLAGDLTDGGWVRGEAALERIAADVGGGLTFAPLLVNGTGVAELQTLPCARVAGTDDGARLVPCPTNQESRVSLDTRAQPFHDGTNSLVACASDFGDPANVTCVEKSVQVDNEAPTLSFRDQNPDDPEQIRVLTADASSGLLASAGRIEYRQIGSLNWTPLATNLEGDHLVARVDSVSEPAGEYEFRASIEDVAGNVGSTNQREGGEPMTLTFPLKDPVRVDAQLGNGATDQLVPFRSEGQVSGRLVDTAGKPIPNQEVQITETFAEGSLIDRRVRTVVTNANGKYESLLPGGPSRDVQVDFAGSRKYLGDQVGGLDFDVRGAATFDTSKRRVRAGSSVAFLGRVKRYYAQIPKGGKLVEVQVKSGTDWITLKEATGTDAKGRVEIAHRFRRFYTERVTFTFRLKVTPENGWPYRGATTTKRRKVTVVPR